MHIARFRNIVWAHYKAHGRSLPWRNTHDPYKILISELMLQQTQVTRVEPKYREFIKKFPNFRALARAPFRNILRAWQGLGYNRRALYLKKIAEEVIRTHEGNLPSEEALLRRLPGVGQSTAGAVRAFAFNLPAVFVETNIRAVFIHHFFPRRKKIQGEEILPFLKRALDRKNPREWYWALMDYGAWLKESRVGYNPRVAGYRPQSRFKGSIRETRGKILELLAEKKSVTEKDLGKLGVKPVLLSRAAAGLLKDGFITKETNRAMKLVT